MKRLKTWWKIGLAAGCAFVLADAALATTLAVTPSSRDVAAGQDASWQESIPPVAASVPLGEVGSGADAVEIPAVAPEPTTLVLVSLGLAGLTVAGRRRLDSH